MKTKTFTVNGKEYTAKEMDFNFMCELEERGVSIETLDKMPMKIAREYLAVTAGRTSEWAGREIEAHIIGGGDITAIYDIITESMETSGFFQALTNQNVPEETGENPKTKRQAK